MNLHFEVSGSGEIPLVCIHGWACDGAQFSELSRLLGKDFRIYRPDLPGHNKTPLNGFMPGFENYTGVIIDFCRQQKLDRPALIGHSMGGVLVMMAAAQRIPLRAIISLDGSLPMAENTIAGQKKIRSWLAESDFRERFATLLRKGFFLPSERDARCEAIIQTMCSAPKAVLEFLPNQIEELDADQILSRIEVPTLFIGSAVPRFDPQKAATLIPHAQFDPISAAGHFLHIYEVEKVAEKTMNFLLQ